MTGIQISRESAVRLAMSMYAGEPCRICRQEITMDDLKEAVWVGYSEKHDGRTAHAECWEIFLELVEEMKREDGEK